MPAAILGLALGLGLPAPALATQDSYGTDSLAYMRGGTPVCWMSASEKGVELLYDADPNITGDETTYTLVMDGLTRIEEHRIVFHTVLDRDGRDISRQFTAITLLEVPGGIVLGVDRDERVDRGKADILDAGLYLMGAEGMAGQPGSAQTPATGGADSGSQVGGVQTPDMSGTYSPEELCAMAQDYYLRHNGYYPPIADYTDNGDGTYTIHLYEMVDNDGFVHTATSAWYTVDAHGVGTDDIFMDEIDLTQ